MCVGDFVKWLYSVNGSLSEQKVAAFLTTVTIWEGNVKGSWNHGVGRWSRGGI